MKKYRYTYFQGPLDLNSAFIRELSMTAAINYMKSLWKQSAIVEIACIEFALLSMSARDGQTIMCLITEQPNKRGQPK